MTPAAIVDRELRIDDVPRPLSSTAALVDLAIIGGYPEPDRTQLREPWRLALRWGWPRLRVRLLLARVERRKVTARVT